MAVKLKYIEVMAFEFVQTIQKIAQTPTNNRAACQIRHVVSELKKAREKITAEYQKEMVEVFGQKNEDGSLKRPEEEANGFLPDETKLEEFKKAQDAFGQREVTIDWRALTPNSLVDIKLSARELELLGPLFSEEEGPGLPNVAHIR